MKQRQINAHMDAAQVYASLSYCNRLKVGCVIVKDNRIISIGYNGTPPGDCNVCEGDNGLTLPSVIHAEDNALRKLEHSPESGEDATMFITASPCKPCAELILKAKIKHVYYSKLYRSTEGADYLREHGVPVDQLT